MILFASLLLAFFPPGILFPQMAMAMSKTAAKKAEAHAEKKGAAVKEGSGHNVSADEDPELGSSRPLTGVEEAATEQKQA